MVLCLVPDHTETQKLYRTDPPVTWDPGEGFGFFTCYTHPRSNEPNPSTEEKGGRNYSLQDGPSRVEDFFNKNTATVGDINVKGQLLAEASLVSVGTRIVGHVAQKSDGLLGRGFKSNSPSNKLTPFEFAVDQNLNAAQRHRDTVGEKH